MTKKLLISFGLLLIVGIATISFYSCGKKEEGVVINGVRWATCNVDKPNKFATNPKDAGMLYQWNRKIGWSAADPMKNSNGKTKWDASISESDTWENANNPCPAGWRLPTLDEIKSLLDEDKVSYERIVEEGMVGARFTDKATGNSIFLPLVNYRGGAEGTLTTAVSSSGFYWSSTLNEDNDFKEMAAYFFTGNRVYDTGWGNAGFSIRCVSEKAEAKSDVSNAKEKEQDIKAVTDRTTSDESIIINGIKWATHNVGKNGTFVAKPEEFGEQPSIYEDFCPNGWRLPTVAELQNLISIGSVWTTVNGVKGRKFGSGNNTIFLPVNGFWVQEGDDYDVSEIGYYMSDKSSADEIFLVFDDKKIGMVNVANVGGCNVRCVAK